MTLQSSRDNPLQGDMCSGSIDPLGSRRSLKGLLVTDYLEKMMRTASGTVQLKSQAMKPLAWLLALTMPSGVALLLCTDSLWIQIVGGCLVAIGPTAFIGAYAYWAKNDPNRLGSEAFVAHQDVLAYAQEAKDPEILQHAPTVLEPPELPHQTMKVLPGTETDDGQ